MKGEGIMKKSNQKIVSGALALTLALGMGGNVLAAGDPTVSVTLDGKKIELKDANGGAVQPVIIDGNTYLPVRGISDALGLEVNWDRATREVQLATSGEAPAGSTQVTEPAVVRLSKGSIMGYNENGIYTFKGVPYGTFERFKYAKPTEAYGTAERPSFALTNGSVSPQSNTRTEYSNWAAAAAFMTPSESDMFSTGKRVPEPERVDRFPQRRREKAGIGLYARRRPGEWFRAGIENL